MVNDIHPAPLHYKGVMVSSTFTDLEQHRAELMNALRKEELFAIGMEEYVPTPADDVISSSLNMVRKGSAYIGLISHRYGQVPECAKRNPHAYSVTRLEFEEAQSLGLPTLIFIMGDDHPGKKADFETDAEKLKKLEAFRRRAKEGRIYVVFQNLEDFTRQAIHAVASLRHYLGEQDKSSTPQPQDTSPPPVQDKAESDLIPAPPAFYAEPPYIGSHAFVGRKAQLDVLSDWAAPADSHPVLLFEAIGGAGKSMLAWEWTTGHAAGVRRDWAGRFWYSFYEKGAIMADFCQCALAYITGKPLEDFRKKRTPELAELLLHHLQARPWLVIFDGLERVLVAYHRFDAAQLTDEQAGAATDQIAQRDPCAAIRPEDDELIRALTAAAPSKLLLTSRLIPRVLLNPASQPIPGVLHERLPGLRPGDAEALPEKSSQLLSTLALLSEAVDYPTLSALNPHLPPEPQEVGQPGSPESLPRWKKMSHEIKEQARKDYQAALQRRKEYEQALKARLHSPEFLAAPQELVKTVRDLEHRGLLQYDANARRYDLHPVVRGIAAGCLRQEEKDHYGQRVVDHLSQQAHSPYEQAETLEDLRDGLHVVRTLLQMGRHQQACDAYRGDLAVALFANLEAYAETLSLLRPFFPQGWATLPDYLDERTRSYLATDAAASLYCAGALKEALAAYGTALLANLQSANWWAVGVILHAITIVLSAQNREAKGSRCLLLTLSLATLIDDKETLFFARLLRFQQLATIGQWPDAEAMWRLLDPMGRSWQRAVYRPGHAEFSYAQLRFYQGDMTEDHLARAEQLAQAGKNRFIIRALHYLRGEWQLEQDNWNLAADSLHEAVRMARQVGQTDAEAETLLALAKFHLNQLPDPPEEAERLAKAKDPDHRTLAELWLAIADRGQAAQHALAAYKWAWADGEPYVHRYELNKARALLEQLGADIPNLPPYDPAKDQKLPWEDEVAAAIEKLRTEKEPKKPSENSE